MYNVMYMYMYVIGSWYPYYYSTQYHVLGLWRPRGRMEESSVALQMVIVLWCRVHKALSLGAGRRGHVRRTHDYEKHNRQCS